MKKAEKLLLTKARVLFWLWCLPGMVWLIWMTAARPDLETAPFFLFTVWLVAGFWGINLSAIRHQGDICSQGPCPAPSQSFSLLRRLSGAGRLSSERART